jgi:hypothetical protein
MESKFTSKFAMYFRLLITGIVLLLLKYIGISLLWIMSLPFIFDTLDCFVLTVLDRLHNFFTVKDVKDVKNVKNVKMYAPYICSDQNVEYQIADKIMDIITYIAIILLFGKQLGGHNNSVLLWGLVVWRIIGVIQFTRTQDKKYLKIFFDGINAAFIVIYASTIIPYVNDHFTICMVVGLLCKIVFEMIHHKSKFISRDF